MSLRIYLDFDGVVSPNLPGIEHGPMLAVEGDCVQLEALGALEKYSSNPGIEIIWATHREEFVHDITDQLGIPRHPHLTFTDPTGSKVKDIIAHYTAHPCDYAVVFEDSLTGAEVEALNDAGITVRLFDNCIHQSTHEPEGK